jgi:uncharacterized protein (DUF2126 family)
MPTTISVEPFHDKLCVFLPRAEMLSDYSELTSASNIVPKVNALLTFDISDTRIWLSLGGCRYHVAYKSRRHFNTLPANGNETEARQLSRLEPWDHTTISCTPPDDTEFEAPE